MQNPFDVPKPECQLHLKWLARLLNDMIGSTEVTLGKGNIYPEFLVHWCEFFTSGLGQFVSNILSTLLDVVTGESVELCCILFFSKGYGRDRLQCRYRLLLRFDR